MRKFSNIIIAFCIISFFMTPTFAATNDEIREQAKILYMGNQLEKAQKNLLQIPASQRTAEDYFILGNTITDLKQAIRTYEEAIKLDENFYQAYYNIGSRYMEVQNYPKAIFYFKQSVKHKKDFAYGHYNLGCAYLKTEQYNLARKSFEEAIKLKPEEPDYYYNLAFAYKKMENLKRAEKAIKLYNDLMKKRNEN